ncbi:MAG: hypothetical protein C7B46_18970 [Sulfobacillus benefaciens]|uniref:Uncharacterized protein n=1 Tax=Sulfobacillus benefaciens TaxID=453960 RepID=A0A2T2X2C8_9FIRM|nr:MAG: hypothetical protein C7B46_18970 [Sulfobacillus benefaciens]
MSTHLEHGTRLPVLSITALNALIHTYRTQVASVAQTLYDQQCAELVYQTTHRMGAPLLGGHT